MTGSYEQTPLQRAVDAYLLVEELTADAYGIGGVLCAPAIIVEQGLLAALPHLVPHLVTPRTTKAAAGILFRWSSLWIGFHWSSHNRRLCVNVVPFVTFWLTLPGGIVP